MSCLKIPPYILQELPDITDSIKYPIKNVQRIKYTCFDVSKTLIAFGATSGGIYIFNRNPCEFVQLIPNKDGAITRLAISPDEKHIGFANGKGVVTVTACDQSIGGGYSTVSSKEHQGNEVTAMVWGRNNMLFTGDDVARVAVLQLQSFIAKTMFQISAQTIMCLDSRVCQLDVKGSMLLVSTITRCYICDTSREQYRQIGQKLRDGEFGACFFNKNRNNENVLAHNVLEFTEVKQFNIVDDDTGFAVSEELVNTLIYCARPSSRLWEATVDGTVRRTHQFKQVLAKEPMNLLSLQSYNNENVCFNVLNSNGEGQSICFPKIYTVNDAIFSYRKDGIYFLNLQNVDDTTWYPFSDIADCKIHHDIIYIWLNNGSLISLKYTKVEKFLVQCYIDEKYVMCAEMCALFREHLLDSNLSPKLHILSGLSDKLENKELLKNIEVVLKKIDGLKSNDATQMKSGIYIVDNTYQTQSSLLLDGADVKHNEDSKFGPLSPDTLQAFKELSTTVSDKLNTSKKMLKEKWEGLEGKIKTFHETQPIAELNISKRVLLPEENSSVSKTVLDDNNIRKESSQKAIRIDNNGLEKDNVCKSLYQYFRLSLDSKETERSNLVSIIDSNTCDVREIYNLMLQFQQYCISVGALEESKFAPNNIFLTYLSNTLKKDIMLDTIINDEVLYKYFVDSCISVNLKTQKLSNKSCECGYPLPYTRTNQLPVFSELIDEFIERQWSSQSRDQCYEMCKRMPYLWRKILYLRRNEDLLNVLRILLQMLDEGLLHSFLPQFTMESWDRSLQLYATLHANMCLNCNKKFHDISVRDMLSWDDLGALMIKSIGGRNALRLMEKHAKLIDIGEVTMKFYHTCLVVSMYEKYDVTITTQLTETLYSCYDFEDSRQEICHLLRGAINGQIANTALPMIVAANSNTWGLTPIREKLKVTDEETTTDSYRFKKITLKDIIKHMSDIIQGCTDCVLCGLPLQNEVLIKDGGLWVFKCGHTYHGACLNLNKVKLCPSCPKV
ncbi:WD40 repeat domain-containing protein pink [Aphomia sociella]